LKQPQMLLAHLQCGECDGVGGIQGWAG